MRGVTAADQNFGMTCHVGVGPWSWLLRLVDTSVSSSGRGDIATVGAAGLWRVRVGFVAGRRPAAVDNSSHWRRPWGMRCAAAVQIFMTADPHPCPGCAASPATST